MKAKLCLFKLGTILTLFISLSNRYIFYPRCIPFLIGGNKKRGFRPSPTLYIGEYPAGRGAGPSQQYFPSPAIKNCGLCRYLWLERGLRGKVI
jgi:hypothetical protein